MTAQQFELKALISTVRALWSLQRDSNPRETAKQSLPHFFFPASQFPCIQGCSSLA